MLGEHAPLWGYLYPALPERVRIGIHPEYTYAIFTLAFALLTAMGLTSLRVPHRMQYGLGLLVALDLWVVGSGRPMNCASLKLEPGVTNKSFGGNAKLLTELKRLSLAVNPPSRIDTTTDANVEWSANGPITSIPTANGLSPLALESIVQLRLFLHDGERWGCYYPIEKVDSPVIGLMGIRYVVTSGQQRKLIERSSRYRHIASLPLDTEVFENLSVLPRFFLVHDVQNAGTTAKARWMIGRGDLDFRKTAIVDGPPLPRAGEIGGSESVSLIAYHPNALSLKVHGTGRALLVLSESYYPGWNAWIDGVPAAVYRTDIAFRGVYVPDGDHIVRMEFSPLILKISLCLSLLTAIALAGMALSPRISTTS